MRIDKFLKVSRILKRRALAKSAAESGRISVGGRQVKPSYDVKKGDVVEIAFLSGSVKFRVNDVKETVKKDEASELFTVLEENV